jgi:hypothetical protein
VSKHKFAGTGNTTFRVIYEERSMNRTMQFASYLSGVILLLSGNVFAAHENCPNPADYPFNECELEGLRPGSYPYFDFGVRIKYKSRGEDGFDLKVKSDNDSNRADFLLDLDEVFQVVENPKYNLRAKYRDGAFVENKSWVEIKGAIPDLGITERDVLFYADLEGDPVLSDDGQLLGMNTTGLQCHSAFAMYCTEAESVYLAFLGALDPEQKKLKTSGIAVTTIPIPAAVWLFGSGLIGMVVMARRKHTNLG